MRGRIVGLMLMEDEKGIDSKVVLSPLDGDGRPTHPLTPADQDRIGAYFDSYKRHEPSGVLRRAGLELAGRRAGPRHDDPRVLPAVPRHPELAVPNQSVNTACRP